MPTRLRAATSRGVAAVALVSALLLSFGTAGARADAAPAIHAGTVGGVAAPSTGGRELAAGEIFGGGGASGASPGGGTPRCSTAAAR